MAGLKLAPVPGDLVAGRDQPLLSATIDMLPPVGTVFTAEQRQNWIAMISMAFNVVYGGAVGGAMSDTTMPAGKLQLATVETVQKPVKLEHAGFDYYIDAQGYARNTVGDRVTADEVPNTEQIYEYRRGPARDRSIIIWADDATGVPQGASFTFAGPG